VFPRFPLTPKNPLYFPGCVWTLNIPFTILWNLPTSWRDNITLKPHIVTYATLPWTAEQWTVPLLCDFCVWINVCSAPYYKINVMLCSRCVFRFIFLPWFITIVFFYGFVSTSFQCVCLHGVDTVISLTQILVPMAGLIVLQCAENCLYVSPIVLQRPEWPINSSAPDPCSASEFLRRAETTYLPVNSVISFLIHTFNEARYNLLHFKWV